MPDIRIQRGLFLLLLGIACLATGRPFSPATAEEKSLAEELPRLPAVEPDHALQTFHVERGFQLELVAAEPLVGDPVDACFDENGRMFVAEFHAYPYALEKDQIIPAGKGRTTSGIIRMLEDTNGDGVMDRSTVFADQLDWPVSVAVYQGGVFVIDPPEIYYLKDTDGDGRADLKETVFSHLGRNNVQGIANNLKWGLDNRIWVASGSNGGEVHRRGEKLLKIGRNDWSFDPRTEQVELATGGIQFGHSMNDWGDRFLCSNSAHINQVVFEEKYLARNPYYTVPSPVRQIALEGGAAPVFRRSPLEPWRIVRTRRRVADPRFQNLPATEKVPGGFFTSAAGVTIYRGSAYPEEYRGNAFIGDVGSNLVHRKVLHPQDATFQAVRADQNTEFVASTDTWFRPVNYVNAPDGSLYILDMYRETIEHPIAIPDDIKAHLDLESGNNRGRIYRLVSPGMTRTLPPRLGEVPLAELVDNLAASNSWNRETAQRLLWERQDQAAVPLIIQLFKTTKLPQGQLHALWTLRGLNALTPELLETALQNEHPGIRRHAAALSEPFLATNPALANRVLALADDPEYRPRLQAALAVSWMEGELALQGLQRFASRVGTDRDLQAAFLLSVRERGEPLTRSLLSDSQFCQRPDAPGLLSQIVELVGVRPEAHAAQSLLTTLMNADMPGPWRPRLLLALGAGLSRRGTNLSALLQQLPADDPSVRQMGALFDQAAQTALDEHESRSAREQAMTFLACAPWERSASTFESLMAPQVSQEIQSAALSALASVPDPAVAALLIRSWRGMTPASRTKALDVLLGRADRTEQLLGAIEAGTMQQGEIDQTKHSLLLNHPQERIRKRAGQLFAAMPANTRRKVVDDYQVALDLVGDQDRGKEWFRQKCAVCHKLGDIGHQVGPDLTSVQNKIPADLLVAILDPNREAQLNFKTYTVSTQNGQIYSGIIAAESAGSLTLRRAEAKEDVVLRSQIDELISSGLSLMPEGLEKELSPQQIADLIAFIKSLKGTAPQ